MKKDYVQIIDDICEFSLDILVKFHRQVQNIVVTMQRQIAEKEIENVETRINNFNVIEAQLPVAVASLEKLQQDLEKMGKKFLIVSQEQMEITKIAQNFIAILDKLLAAGDWQQSPFLCVQRNHVIALKDRLDVIGDGVFGTGNVKEVTAVAGEKDYVEVSIVLYQVDGSDMVAWFDAIGTIGKYLAAKSVYMQEKHAQEFIRSKVEHMERNGYVVVKVKKTDCVPLEGKADQFGNQIFTIRDGVINLEHIVEFVHANAKRYKIHNGKLVLAAENLA